MRLLLVALLLVSLGGCSIKQNVTPAAFEAPTTTRICMIPAQGLRAGFHKAYREQLLRKGFTVQEHAANASPSGCALSTRYTANWAWDLAMYMVYADIQVFQDGKRVGQATYDAKWGGGRLDKFIDAEDKITELTEQLFPQGAPQPISLGTSGTGTPLSKAAYRQEQLRRLMDERLPYEEYQRRYHQLMAE